METKYYPVFRVDTTFQDCPIDYKLIGAESREDLIKNFKWQHILPTMHSIKRMSLDKERIQPVANLFTNKPYTIIESIAYHE